MVLMDLSPIKSLCFLVPSSENEVNVSIGTKYAMVNILNR
jgi:hypothetical protein